MEDIEEALRTKSKHDDLERIIRGLLQDVTHLGQDLSGSEYKLSYFSEPVPVEALREWVNWASALQRQIAELGEVLNERR